MAVELPSILLAAAAGILGGAMNALAGGGTFATLPALIALGPAAEEPVRGALAHDDWTVRLDACRVLKEIGVPASLPALVEAARRPNDALVSRAAEEAIRAIEARGKVEAGGGR